jgi:O-antigen/teichoic acid export membrane protein
MNARLPDSPHPAVPTPSHAKVKGGIRGHFAAPLYRNAYFLMASAGFTSVLGFLFWSVAAHRFEADVVGVNSAVISAMILVSGICQLGLNAVIVRYLPQAGAETRRLVLVSYAATGALSALVALAAALTSASWSPTLRVLADDGRWLGTFVVACAAWTIFSLQDSVMVGLRQARWIPVENSAASAAKIVILVLIAGLVPSGGIFVAWTVPVVLALFPVNLLIFRHLIPRHLTRPATASWDSRKFAALAAGNYAGSLFLLASTALLPILVANESGATTTAYFYVPWMIATAVQLVAFNMATSLTVEVAFDESKLREYCRRVLVQMFRLVIPIVLVLILGAPYVLHAFGPQYASEGAVLLRLLGLATIPNMIIALGLSVARIQHSWRTILGIQGALCALTLGLSVILLRRLGIEGIGLAVLGSQTVVAASLMFGILRAVLFTPRASRG